MTAAIVVFLVLLFLLVLFLISAIKVAREYERGDHLPPRAPAARSRRGRASSC